MKVKFKKGLSSNLPTQLNSGTTYLTTDKPNFIFDLDNERFSLLPLFNSNNNNHVLSIQTGGKLSWWDNYEQFDKNQIPISIDENGNIFNGTGYILGKRLSSNGSLKDQANTLTTGFMPIKQGQEIYMNGGDMITSVNYGFTYLSFYDKNFKLLGTCNWYYDSYKNESIHQVSNAHRPELFDKPNCYYEINGNGLHHYVISFLQPIDYAYVRLSIDITEHTDTDSIIFFLG